MGRVQVGGLSVAEELHAFVRDEALPGTGVDEDDFWSGAERLLDAVAPRLKALLGVRADLQAALDDYHASSRSRTASAQEYEDFLREIGYLTAQPDLFTISTSGVDREISHQPGPQLVVPVLNARFAINAANARWGSLYDAMYGSDVLSDDGPLARGARYNPVRGAEVVRRGREFLDEHFPLAGLSHAGTHGYTVDARGLTAAGPRGPVRLADPAQLVGFTGEPGSPTSVLLVHHGLHVELVIDRSSPIGASDAAGLSDIVLESAVTAIMDLEDSVAAVDTADKVLGYRNWLGLIRGTLSAEVSRDGATFTRRMNEDRVFRTPSGASVRLPGTALLFVRQVGHLMTTDAVLDSSGEPISEGVLDALVTALCSVDDLRGPGAGRNSRTGAMYAVKPKMHGPDEVALACEIFGRVEAVLDLPAGTIKIGIMDEERRTSANLLACIHAARDRVAFINTGFLDRTGDEIRTSTHAGPMVRKAEMKGQDWIAAYEDRNVALGLRTGFLGRAQIGKGMWAAPDDMADMLREKVAHPLAGASCAWVPSPTAATLHALHYHAVDVQARQRELVARPPASDLRRLLRIPLGDPAGWTEADRRAEVDNNVQSTLGYVVRWVDAGVGCSKVADINGTLLMEDRATCRISSQLVSNWLLHGVVSAAEVEDSLRRMAVVVDAQNADDPSYEPMAPSYDGPAFRAARELLMCGVDQPSGYTEPVLHRHRLLKKADSSGGRR